MITEGLNASLTGLHDVEYHPLLPRWGYALAGCALFLIGFFGFFLNLLAMVLMIKDTKLWTPLNMILFNLVCSDFSVSVLGNPIAFIASLFHRWVFGETICMMYGFFMALLGINSITTLTVLSYERYEMVAHSLSARRLTSKRAAFTIAGIWCYSLAVTSPPLFGWSGFVNEAANISCSVNWKEQTTNALTYILYLFALGQVLPVFIIFYSYLSIIITIKRNAARLGQRNKAESQVTWMVFVMILAFMVAWTPYSLVALTEQFAPHIVIPAGLGVIPAIFAKSSICYNPLIYIGMNTQFKASIKQRMGLRTKGDSPDPERGLNETLISPAPAFSYFETTTTKLAQSSTSNYGRSFSLSNQIKDRILGVPQTSFRGNVNPILETENESLSKNCMKDSSAHEKTADNKVHTTVGLQSTPIKDNNETKNSIFNNKINSLNLNYFDDDNSGTECNTDKNVNKPESRQCHLYQDEDCNHLNVGLWNNRAKDEKYSDSLGQYGLEVYKQTGKQTQKMELTPKNKGVTKSLSSPATFSETKHGSSSEISGENRPRVFSFGGGYVRVPYEHELNLMDEQVTANNLGIFVHDSADGDEDKIIQSVIRG